MAPAATTLAATLRREGRPSRAPIGCRQPMRWRDDVSGRSRYGVDEAVGMRIGRVVVVLLVLVAVSAPVAIAFGFDDGVKPPRGILDSPYSFGFKGRNGCPPYTFVFQNGSLPPGLSMNAAGVIAGVPTAVGRYSFWVELRDSGCSGGSCPPAGSSCSFPSQRPFTIDIVAPLSVAAPPLIVAENGVQLTRSVHARGR